MQNSAVLPERAARHETPPENTFEPGGEVKWLWPRRIPLGKVTLIEGDEGIGKSFVVLDLAARVSRGMAWPDGASVVKNSSAVNNPPSVMMVTRPDEFDSHYQRLAGMGADLSRFCWWRDPSAFAPASGATADAEFDRPLEFPTDLAVLHRQLAEHKSIRVVVIDSLADVCRKPQAAADTLRLLNQMAEEHGVAVLVTVPARARIDSQQLLRVTSRWRTDQARCVWSVVADPDDPRRKLFIPRRVNFCEEFPGLEFRLAGGQVAWNGASKIDPLDPLDYWKSLEKCLNRIMEEGCVPATDVFRQGKECGFNPKQLRSGARRLGIESYKSAGFGSDGCWQWYTAAQRQALLAGMAVDGPDSVGWALPTTSGVNAPVASENAGGQSPPYPAPVAPPITAEVVGGQTRAPSAGDHSPPNGCVAANSVENASTTAEVAAGKSQPDKPTSTNAKNAESLENYEKIWDGVWNRVWADMARDKPPAAQTATPPAAAALPAWKRPRKKR